MPCLSFTSTMTRGSTECQRLCVLARIDNTRRSSRAETNPSSYGTRFIDRHLSLLCDLRLPRYETRGRFLEGVAALGNPEARNWQAGEHRDVRRCISSNTHERTLSKCSFFRVFCVTKLRELFHIENIVVGIFVQRWDLLILSLLTK